MRGVLARVSAVAAGRILDSANPREIELHRRLCPLQRRRERTQPACRGSTTSSVKIDGTCVSKNLDETVCLQSEKRQEWMREMRGERLQEIAEDASSAPVWPAHQPRRSTGETSVRGPIVA